MNPIPPKQSVTSNAIHTYWLPRSAHSRVAIRSVARISTPPMVGVPFLVRRWDGGPSSRIGWPSPWCCLSQRISGGPRISDRNSAVTAAPPVRSVM